MIIKCEKQKQKNFNNLLTANYTVLIDSTEETMIKKTPNQDQSSSHPRRWRETDGMPTVTPHCMTLTEAEEALRIPFTVQAPASPAPAAGAEWPRKEIKCVSKA